MSIEKNIIKLRYGNSLFLLASLLLKLWNNEPWSLKNIFACKYEGILMKFIWLLSSTELLVYTASKAHQNFLFTLKNFAIHFCFSSKFISFLLVWSYKERKKKLSIKSIRRVFQLMENFTIIHWKVKSEKNKKQIVEIINYGKYLNNFVVIPCHSALSSEFSWSWRKKMFYKSTAGTFPCHYKIFLLNNLQWRANSR